MKGCVGFAVMFVLGISRSIHHLAKREFLLPEITFCETKLLRKIVFSFSLLINNQYKEYVEHIVLSDESVLVLNIDTLLIR